MMSQNYTIFLKWQENSTQKLQAAAQIVWAVVVAVRLMCAPVVVGEDVGTACVRTPIRKFRFISYLRF